MPNEFKFENAAEKKLICWFICSELLTTKRDQFDYVMLETTGLADPAPIVQVWAHSTHAHIWCTYLKDTQNHFDYRNVETTYLADPAPIVQVWAHSTRARTHATQH